MRPKTLILFFVAIGCGLVASIGVSQYMDKARNSGAAPIDTIKVYVAGAEINIGDKLDDKNIKLEEWPKDRVPEGAISELKELENKYPRTRLYKGEPILVAKVSDKIDGNKPNLIPGGFRVVAVKVNAESAVGNLISPGDHVDLVVFMRKSAEVPETTTKTILRDVTVFACDSETERAVDKGTGQSHEMRTISLLVRPKQADIVTLAKELGALSLTLRRPNDTNDESSDGENIQSLLGSDGNNGSQKKHDGDDSGLASFLNQTASQPPAPPAADLTPAPPVVPEEPAKFIMKIRTPNGDREYHWKDLNGEPEEAGGNVSSSQAPPPAAAFQPVSLPAPGTPNGPPVEARAIPKKAAPRTNTKPHESTNKTSKTNSTHSAEPVSADGGTNEK